MEQLEIKLKEFGYKMTPQRKDIYDFIKNNEVGNHVSCEEIYKGLVEKNPESDIGLATVYRTVQLFTSIGILTKHDFDQEKSQYELASLDGEHLHHHLICTECGTIQEVRFDLMEKVERLVEKEYNFKVENHNVKISGTCSACQKKKS